ncbi:Protein of unknown function [Devosia enhydra]|uniref:Uncharacterized protein n=1 Tax=Devosia enhydra TaxID=665118 RepID=A0A1K2I4E6_9HYPH|nr:DUF3298 domain-containing protein [Devosia enhydra]SFZ86604.1 Protein of unknown function [Devosia enhydra]
MNKAFLVLLAGLGTGSAPLLSMPAGAASFDCGRATTAFERAICADPELSGDDEVLAVAYATAIGGLSADAGATMRAGQREWLAYVERACTPDGQPLAAAYDDDGLNCLKSEFTSRISGLEESRMIGGKRFYLLERFKTEPPSGEEEWNKVKTTRVSVARIDGTDALAEAFNAYVAGETADWFAAIDAEAQNAANPEAEAEEGEDEFDADTDTTLVVDRVASRMISLEATEYWYGHGAAHGNYAITYRHFLSDQMRPLEASDIFAGEDWATPLAGIVSAALKAQMGDGLWDDYETAVAEAVVDPARWRFTESGMEFRFQPYEVTAYAAGAPVASVPWHDLRDILTEDGEYLGSF